MSGPKPTQQLPVAMSVTAQGEAASAAAQEPSALWEQLDELANAEPMTAEDDLIYRMQAVSKVCRRKGAGAKEKKAKGSDAKPRRSIEKPKRPKRQQPMKS